MLSIKLDVILLIVVNKIDTVHASNLTVSTTRTNCTQKGRFFKAAEVTIGSARSKVYKVQCSVKLSYT